MSILDKLNIQNDEDAYTKCIVQSDFTALKMYLNHQNIYSRNDVDEDCYNCTKCGSIFPYSRRKGVFPTDEWYLVRINNTILSILCNDCSSDYINIRETIVHDYHQKYNDLVIPISVKKTTRMQPPKSNKERQQAFRDRLKQRSKEALDLAKKDKDEERI